MELRTLPNDKKCFKVLSAAVVIRVLRVKCLFGTYCFFFSFFFFFFFLLVLFEQIFKTRSIIAYNYDRIIFLS